MTVLMKNSKNQIIADNQQATVTAEVLKSYGRPRDYTWNILFFLDYSDKTIV